MEIQALPVIDSVDNPLAGYPSDVFDCEMAKDRRSSSGNALLQAGADPLILLSDEDEMEGKSSVVTVAMGVSQRVKKIASEEGDVGRRISTRLQNKEKPFYGCRKAVANVDKKISKKRARVDMKLGNDAPLIPMECNGAAGIVDLERCNLSNLVNLDGNNIEMKGASSGNPDNLLGRSDYARVKDALRIFNNYYLHFVQEEEKRCKKIEADEKKTSKALKSKVKKRSDANDTKIAKASKSKGGSVEVEDSKRHSKRPDLKAISKMMETHSILYSEKRLGHLPGIDVGHQFFSRAEMVVLGFHSHWLNGIDYMGGLYSKMEEYKHYTFPLAVSIVMSGMYEDDLDNCEDIVYTGQGGQNLLGDKRQIRDQVMLRGNLALKDL